MLFGALCFLALFPALGQTPQSTPETSAQPTPERTSEAIKRVSEEAEMFAKAAPTVLAQETLRQQVALPAKRRFKPRSGTQQPSTAPRLQVREVVAEYGYSEWKTAPGVLHEARKVITVDGHEVEQPEKARATLTMGIRNQTDELYKQTLRDFEKYGLVGAATDFGQLILQFRRRNLDRLEFSGGGRRRLGVDDALAIVWREKPGSGSLTIFEGRKALHERLQGELWVRESDSMPLRVVMISPPRRIDRRMVSDVGIVDYVMSPHGFVVPVSVTYRQMADNHVLVENLYSYSSFQKFTADTAIKFTELPQTQTPEKTR